MTKPQKLTESGLARDLGVSRQAVHDLVKRSILSKDKDGLIDVEMAKIALLNRVRPSGKTTTNLSETPAAESAPPPPPTDTDEKSEITSYHVAKTLREAAEAQIARHKLAEMQGKVVNKSDMDSGIFEIARAIRDGLTNCARRIAADVAGLDTAPACEAVIDREHRALMENMVKQFTDRLNANPTEAAA